MCQVLSATDLVGWKPHSIIVPYLPLPLGFCCPSASFSQQKIIHLLVRCTQNTLFLATCIYHSKFIKTSGRKKRGGKRNLCRGFVFLHPLHTHCHMVPQVLTGSDTEMRMMLLNLSLQLCLFLESTALSGQMMITVE